MWQAGGAAIGKAIDVVALTRDAGLADFIAEQLEHMQGPDAPAWFFKLQTAMGRHTEAAASALAAARAEQAAGNYKVWCQCADKADAFHHYPSCNKCLKATTSIMSHLSLHAQKSRIAAM